MQYRWHPYFNHTLAVRQASGHNGEQLLCELPDGTMSLVPEWMTSAEACSGLSVGRPQVSLAALNRLREVADALVRGRCGAQARSTGSDPKATDQP